MSNRAASAVEGAQGERGAKPQSYHYYDILMSAFVCVLLCSNLIGPAKTCELEIPFVGPLTFGAGNLFFPISYIFGDVLTEVYGYAKARKVIWVGFGAMLFATVMSAVILHMPAAASEPYNEKLQPALELVFGGAWRIALGSILAFWAGDFANSYVLAKMKVLTRGRMLWTRTIGSTIVGQFVDSIVFYPIAFGGVWSGETIVKVIAFNWLFKVSVEACFTPVTYWVVGFLKRAERVDWYDTDTDFSPFHLDE